MEKRPPVRAISITTETINGRLITLGALLTFFALTCGFMFSAAIDIRAWSSSEFGVDANDEAGMASARERLTFTVEALGVGSILSFIGCALCVMQLMSSAGDFSKIRQIKSDITPQTEKASLARFLAYSEFYSRGMGIVLGVLFIALLFIMGIAVSYLVFSGAESPDTITGEAVFFYLFGPICGVLAAGWLAGIAGGIMRTATAAVRVDDEEFPTTKFKTTVKKQHAVKPEPAGNQK